MNKTISFIQFLRPDGRRTPTEIDIEMSDALAHKVDDILAHGFEFQSELLTNGMASFTISDDHGDYAHCVCSNGPAVPDGIYKMIHDFDIETGILMAANAWREQG